MTSLGYEKLTSRQLDEVIGFVNNKYLRVRDRFLERAPEIDVKTMNKFRELVLPIYRELRDQTNCDFIVDSSKSPSYLYLLANCTDLDISVIHLIRDSRAVVYSMNRTKRKPETENESFMKKSNIFPAALGWLTTNYLSQYFQILMGKGKYTALEYEKMVMECEDALKVISQSAGMSRSFVHPVQNGAITIRDLHIIAGNPVRFNKGEILLKVDNEWENKMGILKKIVVTLVTFPFKKSFGKIR